MTWCTPPAVLDMAGIVASLAETPAVMASRMPSMAGPGATPGGLQAAGCARGYSAIVASSGV
jgi:hypothetical protein